MGIDYDGFFDYEGNKIYYYITDDNKPIKIVRGIEKMSRFITFYDERGTNIGTREIYGDTERLQNIGGDDALDWYLNSNLVKKKV